MFGFWQATVLHVHGTKLTVLLLRMRAGHASGLVALDVSADARALVAVGQDAASRQLMVLWDISGLRHGDKVGSPKGACLALPHGPAGEARCSWSI